METKEFSSLSAEFVNDAFPGFVCTVFEASAQLLMEDGVPSQAFLEREEEFNIITVPFLEQDGSEHQGILCAKASDAMYLKRWGQEKFARNYREYGIEKIWGWKEDSGLRPCAIYLRHCLLATKLLGNKCFDSFLDETFLVDRQSTIQEYLKENPQVMSTLPPIELAEKNGG